jgi:hypothetical protein
MVTGSDKTYGELILQAQSLMDTGQEVGETVEPMMRQLKNIIEQVVQMQYDQCMKEGFDLPKYYIHIFIVKDPLASQGMGAHNILRIRKPHVRVTRPSPYQDEDHYLWSVTNYDHIKFEWCIPTKETMHYILQNPHMFDKDYVRMLKLYCDDKFEKLEDYLVGDKII